MHFNGFIASSVCVDKWHTGEVSKLPDKKNCWQCCVYYIYRFSKFQAQIMEVLRTSPQRSDSIAECYVGVQTLIFILDCFFSAPNESNQMYSGQMFGNGL